MTRILNSLSSHWQFCPVCCTSCHTKNWIIPSVAMAKLPIVTFPPGVHFTFCWQSQTMLPSWINSHLVREVEKRVQRLQNKWMEWHVLQQRSHYTEAGGSSDRCTMGSHEPMRSWQQNVFIQGFSESNNIYLLLKKCTYNFSGIKPFLSIEDKILKLWNVHSV